MKQEFDKISIARIQEMYPELKGIDNGFVMDRREFYISEEKSPVLKYPLRLDGVAISIREKGRSKGIINLQEYDLNENDMIICAPGNFLQSVVDPGVHRSQLFLISSGYLKEMYINMNNFLPFFISLKEKPVFHLTDEEMGEQTSFYQLIEDNLDGDDVYREEIVRRLMGGYIYKVGSILYKKKLKSVSENMNFLKREEVLFNQFINLLTEHHRKERRVDFYAEQLFLSSKHFSTVVKKVSGKTAREWIDEYVILEAKALLKYSVMSIQEVAYFMNFPNPSFFGKYFKHHTGMSPSEYKMQ